MTRTIDVAFLPAEARRADVTVVIDVLRATSTITQAIEAGYRRVLCVDTLERARALAAPGRVLAGERHCVRPQGFDLGNSPVETTPPRGDELVLATTNGAPAIVRAAALSPIVVIACLRNLDAVTEATPAGDVQLLCAGTDGAPSLEDSYVAGRIAARLGGRASDSALIARTLARAYASAREALAAGAGGHALAAVDLESDIAWCAEESVLAVVPTLCETGEGFAIVHDGTQRVSERATGTMQGPPR